MHINVLEKELMVTWNKLRHHSNGVYSNRHHLRAVEKCWCMKGILIFEYIPLLTPYPPKQEVNGMALLIPTSIVFWVDGTQIFVHPKGCDCDIISCFMFLRLYNEQKLYLHIIVKQSNAIFKILRNSICRFLERLQSRRIPNSCHEDTLR